MGGTYLVAGKYQYEFLINPTEINNMYIIASHKKVKNVQMKAIKKVNWKIMFTFHLSIKLEYHHVKDFTPLLTPNSKGTNKKEVKFKLR